ncbi:beta-ketoacyl synthase N-terminal-like domain-containing protein [Nocardia sp. CA-128927]|uniref:beta-ketoacyl synthase N-terminal-like domain-containing protein n=1 Tax=Nocardia sp. CA-128927 TaxID=3239975 RepID=UPI003D975C31
MTPEEENGQLRALLRKSLATIRELNQEAAAGTGAAAPVAIIGTACELPGGADSPEAFWELLNSGKSCERDAPASEWLRNVHSQYFAQHPAAAAYAPAYYLDRDVMRFDPRPFNISPNEAREMDPTQRLALKLTTQALERAGYNPWRMTGKVGVYFGVIGGEYGALARKSAEPGHYVATGTLDSVVSGRISHTFDFSGPALSIDTACSSSLVALHLACDGIRNGDCDVAVVGGVNLLLDPSVVGALAGFGALSLDGRCHPFTGEGQGYGRGEGGAVVVLKRLADAEIDRDDVLAVVRATAVNHDGRCSGLTVPNGRAQRHLLTEALRKAGLRGSDVDYLETHGTGTPLGDPIEMTAASAAYCQDRPADRPLIVGSNKAQIGHLEAASGLASLLKVVLVLQHRRIPAQPGYDALSRTIDFEKLGLRVPDAHLGVPGRELVAAVSSFGFSGTNAHVVIGSPEERARTAGTEHRTHALLLGARSANTLATTIDDAVRYLHATPDAEAEDVCFTYATGRPHGPYRTYVTGTNRDELLDALETLASTPHFTTRSQLTRTGPLKPVFILAGLIPQQPDPRADAWYRSFTGFRSGFDAVATAWTAHRGTPLPRGTRTDSPVEAACHQLAVLSGLIRMWRSFGIEPEIWCPDGIGMYATAIETGARSADCIVGELIALFAATRDEPTFHTSTGIAALRIPAGTGSSSLEPAQDFRFEAAVICPATGEFLSPRKALEPDYWRQAAQAEPDLARTARLCVGHEARVAVVLGLESAPTRTMAAALSVVDLAPDTDALLSALVRLYELGAEVDWAAWYEGTAAHRVQVPTTAYEESTYVLETLQQEPTAVPLGDPLEPRIHPSRRGSSELDFVLASSTLPLADTHNIVHIGYFVEMVLRASARLAPDARFDIAEMTFSTALVVSDKPVSVRLVFDDIDSTAPRFSFHSLVDPDTNRWRTHVSGALAKRSDPPPVLAEITGAAAGFDTAYTSSEFYAAMHNRGLRLGPSVRSVGAVRRSGTVAIADIDPAHVVRTAAATRVAPGILDACAQVFHVLMPDVVPATAAFMVERMAGVIVRPGEPVAPHTIRVDGVHLAPDGKSVIGRFALLDADAATIVECQACTVRWIDSGIDSVIAASDAAADTLRLSVDEIAEISAAPKSTAQGLLEASIGRLIAELTGLPAAEISAADTTAALGIDSIQATRLYRALEPINPRERVELGDLVQGIAIAELAVRLRTDTPESSSPPEELRAVTAKPYLPPRNSDAPLRLLCIPYGGGSTLLFHGWQSHLPGDIEVCPVALPGRGTRLAEPLVPDVYRIVEELTDEVLRSGDGPFALYGHSAGGLISYLLTLRLRERGHPGPRHLYIGAFSSPDHTGNPFYLACREELRQAGYPDLPSDKEIRDLTDPRLETLAGLLRFPAPDADAAFLRMALPILANDIRMVGSFRQTEAKVLDVPITALHGRNDDRVTEANMRGWSAWTSSDFDLHVLDGDHFFLHPEQRRDDVLNILTRGAR